MTIRSPEMEQTILERLMDGDSLRRICQEDGMPDRTTVLRWAESDDEFAAKYARARVIQAHTVNDDMQELEDKVLSGEVEPGAARVILGSKQWRAAKLLPKVYGEKVAVTGNDGKDLIPPTDPMDSARKIAFLLRSAIQKDEP